MPIVPLKLSHIGQLFWTGYEYQLLNHLIHGRYPHDSVHLSLLSPALHDPHLQQVLIVGVPQGPQAHLCACEAAALRVEVQRHQTLQVHQKLGLVSNQGLLHNLHKALGLGLKLPPVC